MAYTTAARRITLTTQQRIALARQKAAVSAHKSRFALAILNGNHDETTVARFLTLSSDLDVLEARMAGKVLTLRA